MLAHRAQLFSLNPIFNEKGWPKGLNFFVLYINQLGWLKETNFFYICSNNNI
jgi:hypothetical protein